MPHTGGGGYEEVAAARRGRFRVTSSSTPQGPPETTLGRFRLMPTSNYGTISPILQRGRFDVIPEEPHGSPAQGTPLAERSLRSPSPEWDFDIEQEKEPHKMNFGLLLKLMIFGVSLVLIKGDIDIELETEPEEQIVAISESANETESDTDAQQDVELSKTGEDNGDDSLESGENFRVRKLVELDVYTLRNYCTDEGKCRDLIFEDPQEVVFIKSKPRVRFTSGTTYVFKPSPKYDVLVFENSKFANFPLNLFYALKVHELDMRQCEVQRLTWDNFLMAEDLSILLLSRNRLREIRPSTFSNAPQLSFLFLDENEIDTLHSQSFKGLSQLYMLDLHDNQLAVLPPGVFSYLHSLQHLNLAGNRLTTLTDGTFANNIRLVNFNVQRNALTSVDEYVFQNQDYMDYLDFSHNPDLETLVGNMRVDNLWARNCSLARINVYGKAKNVDFQQNRITELYFSQPEYLESLRLRDNSLQQLASLSEASRLLYFDVSNNPQLQSMPDEWEVDALERLDVSNISLRTISLSIIETPERLKSLNVSYNQLTHIDPNHFRHYEKLQHLYMHHNNWNCYNLQLFMDMVVKPYRISYTLDEYDETFPGEYIGGIKCMYRLYEEDAKQEDSNLGFSSQSARNLPRWAEQLNEAPTNSDANEEPPSEVEELRREFKAVVGIYEQKFGMVLNKLNELDGRLKQFELFNRTMWEKVTITV